MSEELNLDATMMSLRVEGERDEMFELAARYRDLYREMKTERDMLFSAGVKLGTALTATRSALRSVSAAVSFEMDAIGAEALIGWQDAINKTHGEGQ